MPHASLKLIPGVDQNKTPALNEAAISSSNLIRFVPDRNGLGLVQKLGGWNLFYKSGPIESTVRALLGWQSLSDATYLGVGAESSLSVISNGLRTTLTPQMYVVNVPLSVSTTAGSAVVTITDANSSVDNYDSVYIETQITINGLRLQGLYQCTQLSADTYSITATDVLGNPQPAGSSAPGTPNIPSFTTTSGSSTVSVTLNGHLYSTGDTAAFLIPTTVGGVTIFGNYIVTKDTDNVFKITASSLASSTQTLPMNAGLARYAYYNGIGQVSAGTGYGILGYGAGGFGTGTTPATSRQLGVIGVTGNGTNATASFVMRDGTGASGSMYVIPGTTFTITGVAPSGFNVSASATVLSSEESLSNVLSVVGNGTYATFTHDGTTAIPVNRAINVAGVTPSAYNGDYLVVASTSKTGTASSTSASISGSTLTIGGTIVGTFAVGQVISGTGITSGTTITALGTATGGAGTYTISPAAASPIGPIAISATSTNATVTVQSATTTAYTSGGRVAYSSITYANATSGTYFAPGGTIAIATYASITAGDWTLDNWGEFLIACPNNTPTNPGQPDNRLYGGGIYYWQPESGTPVAQIISNAPPANHGIFVSMPQRQVIAWGSTFNGIQDPLLIRWSDVGNFNVWAGTLTNQAGSYRIPKGSRIVGCIQGPQQGLVWTDLAIWAMQYVGQPYIYSFNEIGNGCGLIAPKAAASMGGVVYWMSQSQFFRLSGSGVEQIPCPIWDVVFQQIDENYLDNIRIAPNSRFGEITWYYPVDGSNGVPTNYVKYNINLNQWDFGTLTRTAWINQSVLGPPIGAGPVVGGSGLGYLVQHETSIDAVDVNDLPAPMNSSFTTGYFQLAEGDLLTFIDQFWPDAKWGLYNSTNQTANLSLTFYVTNYATDNPTIYGPFDLSTDIEYVTPRLRGRLVSLKFESTDTNSFWRLGNMRYRFQQDGKF